MPKPPMPALSAALAVAALAVAGCQASAGVTNSPIGTATSTATSASSQASAPSEPPGESIADVAAPYSPPAVPPERNEPLTIRPSADAAERLGRVLTGNLVDSGGFHQSSMSPDGPLLDSEGISFITPSGNIVCAGGAGRIRCVALTSAAPRPPRPTGGPPGNWGPYILFGGDGLTYGLAVGNPIMPVRAATLPYGSTIRLGDIECLSAEDGLTCVDFPTGTGFHLSREDFTPLKAVGPVAADTRPEPRAPGR